MLERSRNSKSDEPKAEKRDTCDSQSTTGELVVVDQAESQSRRRPARSIAALLLCLILFTILGVIIGVVSLDSKASQHIENVQRTEQGQIHWDSKASRSLACPDTPLVPLKPHATACTAKGCLQGYEIDVKPYSSWPSGVYRYILDVDGLSTIECSGTLPLQGCLNGPNVVCDGNTSSIVSIVESGCALNPERHAFGSIHFWDAYYPRNVHLRIDHDDVTLVDQVLSAKYTISQPNGPHCEPICCFGRDTVALHF